MRFIGPHVLPHPATDSARNRIIAHSRAKGTRGSYRSPNDSINLRGPRVARDKILDAHQKAIPRAPCMTATPCAGSLCAFRVSTTGTPPRQCQRSEACARLDSLPRVLGTSFQLPSLRSRNIGPGRTHARANRHFTTPCRCSCWASVANLQIAERSTDRVATCMHSCIRYLERLVLALRLGTYSCRVIHVTQPHKISLTLRWVPHSGQPGTLALAFLSHI
jgi:hypothetical protein